MPYAELVLLFDTNNLTDIKGQLGKAFDDFSTIGDNKRIPSMMIVRKAIWIKLEIELNSKRRKERDYDRVSPNPADDVTYPTKQGYNALIFRARPVVAIDGTNVVADRVGANDL